MLTNQQVQNLNHLMDSLETEQKVGPYPQHRTGEHYYCASHNIIWINPHATLKYAARLAFRQDPKTWGKRAFPTFLRQPDTARIHADHYGLDEQCLQQIREADYEPLPDHPEMGRRFWADRIRGIISEFIRRNRTKPAGGAGVDTAHLPHYHPRPLAEEHAATAADQATPVPQTVR